MNSPWPAGTGRAEAPANWIPELRLQTARLLPGRGGRRHLAAVQAG